jgi:hypothetical protein
MPECARCGGGIQPLQYFAGAGESRADPVEGGGHVRTVVDQLVDVGEGGEGTRTGRHRELNLRLGQGQNLFMDLGAGDFA